MPTDDPRRFDYYELATDSGPLRLWLPQRVGHDELPDFKLWTALVLRGIRRRLAEQDSRGDCYVI